MNPTIQAYDDFADAYDKSVVEFWEQFPKDFLQLFADSLPGGHILNIGSGSGRDALLLRELGLDVVCMDAAPKMVAITRRLGFDSYCADFATLPFAFDSFDGVWAHGSLVHVSKAAAADIVAQVRTLLKPAGIFAMGVIAGIGETKFRHDIMPGAARYMQLYQDDELRTLVAAAGFRFIYQQSYVLPYDTFLNHLYIKEEPKS